MTVLQRAVNWKINFSCLCVSRSVRVSGSKYLSRASVQGDVGQRMQVSDNENYKEKLPPTGHGLIHLIKGHIHFNGAV